MDTVAFMHKKYLM